MDARVLLIGGTSHAGKSTLARRLAAELGWELLSTDQLARHPGRPWRDSGSLPSDVVDHYSELSADALLASVLNHYLDNVWPIAEALIRCRINNRYDRCLVLEGAALLPDCVAAAGFTGVTAAWITAAPELLTERIRLESRHEQRAVPERRLIGAFLERSIRFDQLVRTTAASAGQQTLDAQSACLLEDLRALKG